MICHFGLARKENSLYVKTLLSNLGGGVCRKQGSNKNFLQFPLPPLEDIQSGTYLLVGHRSSG